MCRWAAYSGDPVYLEDLILSPAHSLIEQSHHARQAKTPINGDGFGVAWYGDRDEPGLYRDILPAWADRNLESLARQIRSGLFLAHVRASTIGETSRVNCHPFVMGNWSFMHNGQIGDFAVLRRPLELALDDTLYNARTGSTDSEILFLLALQFGLDKDPQAAFARTIRFVGDEARKRGVTPFIRFTAAFSCGRRLLPSAMRATNTPRPCSGRNSNLAGPSVWCRNPSRMRAANGSRSRRRASSRSRTATCRSRPSASKRPQGPPDRVHSASRSATSAASFAATSSLLISGHGSAPSRDSSVIRLRSPPITPVPPMPLSGDTSLATM